MSTVASSIRVRAISDISASGLVETHRIPGSRDRAVVLTKEGRGLLESHRAREQEARQTFYDGLRRERELEHDVHIYCACERALAI